MKSVSTRRRVVGALAGVVLGATAMAVGAGPVGAKAPPPGCDNRDNNSERKLLECVSVEGVREHQAALQAIADANGDTRSSGTSGYDASVAYAAGKLRAAGYDVTIQEFDFDFFDDNSSVQTAPTPGDYPVFSARVHPTDRRDRYRCPGPGRCGHPPGSAPNSNTSGCEAADFAGFPTGGVALMQRGTCAFTRRC